MSVPSLFTPLQLGPYRLDHRVVMAPLTRMRAGPGAVPPPLAVTYYAQRASAGGLLISEGAPISPTAHGMPGTPGIHSEAQVAGWRAVTDAVHREGALIFCQLWHVGRISHPSHQPQGALPVAPSAVRPAGQAFTADFRRMPFETPRAIDLAEIPALIDSYRQAGRNAMAAGFDGVEIHGANGYLLEEFLQSRSNRRTDGYGGSIENRARLVIEVAQAVADACGPARVGIRLSPFGIANDSGEDEPLPLYTYVIRELGRLNLAYLHLIEPRASGAGQAEVDHQGVPSGAETFRPVWPGVLITAGNFRADSAAATLAAGHADAIAFGRFFIANPDLPLRLRLGAALNAYDRATFYGGDAEGYTTYPFLDTAARSGAAPVARVVG